MPIETAEVPIDQVDVKLSPPNPIKEFIPFPPHIEDEYNLNDGTVWIKPGELVSTVELWKSSDEDATVFHDNMVDHFHYLSRTRKLEVAGERVRIIQDILDRMTAGINPPLKTRAVIMNKGKEAEAFVAPDGTVFISQSLINNLNSLDEIGGILGHELGHIVNKTSVRATEASLENRLGVVWLHEEVSDQINAPDLLEKSGLNSLAFASGIEKIQGTSRGVEHQSGLARGSQSVGGHFALDRTTSSVRLTPIPLILRREVRKSNLEVARKYIGVRHYLDTNWPLWEVSQRIPSIITHLKPMMEKLHPKDFKDIYEHLLAEDYNRHARTRVRLCNEILEPRLEHSGLSKGDILLFLTANRIGGSTYTRADEYYLLNTPEDLAEVTKSVKSFETEPKFEKIYRMAFLDKSNKFPIPYGSTPVKSVLLGLSEYMYDVDFEKPKATGIPVTREILLNFLQEVSEAQANTVYSARGEIAAYTSQCLGLYINKTFLALAKDHGEGVDVDQLREFFLEVKDRGITFNYKTLISNLPNATKADLASENAGAVINAFAEVYEVTDTGQVNKAAEVDKFFEEFTKLDIDRSTNSRKAVFGNFLEKMKHYFHPGNIKEEERADLLNYIYQVIDRSNLTSRLPVQEMLKGNLLYQPVTELLKPEDAELNSRLLKFNLKSIFTRIVFKGDSDRFYAFLEEAMKDLEGRVENFSRLQLLNLCQPLLETNSFGSNMLIWHDEYTPETTPDMVLTSIGNWERFLTLPLLQKILSKEEKIDFNNIVDLTGHARLLASKLHFYTGVSRVNGSAKLFSDNLVMLIFGREIRDNFAKLLEKGIKESELDNFFAFINAFYPEGPQRDHFLTEINRRYLKSETVPFESKLDYLIANFDRVGPPGMVMLADEITDIRTYRQFRDRIITRGQKYLEGEAIISKIAAGDFLSAFFNAHFDQLFLTCRADSNSAVKTSTNLAKEWFDRVFGNLRSNVFFDHKNGKFVLDEVGRTAFKAISDTFTSLKNMPDMQKFVLAHKALTEQNGALTSDKNRQKLADILVKSLGVENSFIGAVLAAACKEADRKLIAFPASRMVLPLLFRSLDIQRIDIGQLQKHEVYYDRKLSTELSRDEIERIIRTDTRGISEFGADFRNHPNTAAAELAKESDGQYIQINRMLDRLFSPPENETQESSTETRIDPAIESIIRAVETSGALGIRALQLATQFYHFSPAMEKRLSESFDANPGLNKLLFWENLNKLAVANPQIESLLNNIELGDYLGGGSLQTTYAATLTTETGEKRQVVIKMKNPNVEAFIKEGYLSAQRSLEVVARSGRGVSRQYARIGMELMDLAQGWCLDDINDKTYEEDDDQFSETIEGFNNKQGVNTFYAPGRIFTASKLKSEQLAPGKTVNQFLSDPNIDLATKQEVITNLARFFSYQMKSSTGLIHSDPHIGNYIVDRSTGLTRLAVIDRSLYLKLKQEDVRVLEKLIIGGNDNEFVYGFIDRVLDRNNIRGVQRRVTTTRVLGSVYSEYLKQRVGGRIDRLALMRTMLTGLSNAGVDVPLELRLIGRYPLN